jgi:hypothetical protein
MKKDERFNEHLTFKLCEDLALSLWKAMIIFQGDRLFYFLFLVIHSFCSLSGFAYPIHSLRYVLTSNAYCATGTLPPALRMGAIACAVC